MIRSGLLSVTFRQLTPAAIIGLVADAGLQAIEWGGDIHVPHGDVRIAEEVGQATAEAGLRVASYGSYYHTGCSEEAGLAFQQVLDSAIALQAPAIRVWAGDRGSAVTPADRRETMVNDGLRIADMAGKAGIYVDYEFHGNTLTDSNESVMQLMEQTRHPYIRSNWQPLSHMGLEERLSGLQQLGNNVANLHVYHWESGVRLPLSDGTEEWRTYLELVQEDGNDHYAMLEFVKDDDPAQFLQDAATLRTWLSR